ncbi:hypothetical protein SBOR_9784 [Sclerotinia borealis F-4128]|uniref:SNF2 N-terminal domain-containing protein n=1 Tax=Sclerotinia borealis (strain F-4128) TaxID=1432307 RepID=W9C2C4_SCLBF|nr:hypothetical protein SBOR_9784 [Sclerotinia borealis F-4128]
MAPGIVISDEPLEEKKSIGMGNLWDKIKKDAAARKDITPATERKPNREYLKAQQAKSDSSFVVSSPSLQNSLSGSTHNYFNNILKYIPVGCIRIRKQDCSISEDELSSCQGWQALHLPTDIHNFQHNLLYLPNTIQGKLLRSASLVGFCGIHNAGWIRMEFKAKDQHSGQVRVYILPDHVGKAVLDRSRTQLRKGMELLLDKLDISNATWQGTWTDDTPILHIDSSLDAENSRDNISVLDMFNALPSPKPDPKLIEDEYVQDAMRSILKGNVRGLNPDTKLHPLQCQTAAMMLQRETRPAYLLDPRLRPMRDQAGNKYYCDLSASICLREPRCYEAPRGGICAENMGLGKTLICLALILSTKGLASQIPVEHSVGSIPVRSTTGSLLDMAASTIGRLGVPWEIVLRKIESDQGTKFNRAREALQRETGYYWHIPDPPQHEEANLISTSPRKIWLTKTTLIVVRSNLIDQWIQEIEKHATGLNYLVITDMRSLLPTAEVLATYDVILLTQKILEREEMGMVTYHGKLCQLTLPNGCQRCHEKNTGLVHCPCGNPWRATPSTVYHSPLKDLHLKRLITDVRPIFGKVTGDPRIDAMIPIDFLRLDTRWLVSGTPAQGLHGRDGKDLEGSELLSHFLEDHTSRTTTDCSLSPETNTRRTKLFIEQERQALEKLGNILTSYLKARPWANTMAESDQASWLSLVVKPRYDREVHSDSRILRLTLESMIIRHTAEDINEQLSHSPLHKKNVYLEGCLQDKLSLNIFSMIMIVNVITSEREDAINLFHPKSRRALKKLVSSLRQASFTWSGFTTTMIESSLDTAKKFLTKDSIAAGDKKLLEEAIKVGELALKNGIFTAVSRLHELAMYIQNPLQNEVRRAWALDYEAGNPTLMGATMVIGAKEAFNKLYDDTDLWAEQSIIYGEQMMNGKELEFPPGPGQLKKARPNNTEHTPTAMPLGSLEDQENEKWKDSTIVSTISSKLSYLMDQVFLHHNHEKIIIFHEAENMGYYIAQALKCMNIQYLVYTQRDSIFERSRCLVKFNTLTVFRVMLMDVHHAASRLDMSAASRVYFVNPVSSPRVETHAINTAHRIGQLRPVFVETLVLKGSIDEVILTRRGTMNDQEHMHLRDFLDDQTLYDCLRSARFYPIPGGRISGPDQLAPLVRPQLAFTKLMVVSNEAEDQFPACLTRHSTSRWSKSITNSLMLSESAVRSAELSSRVRALGADLQYQILDRFRQGLNERMAADWMTDDRIGGLREVDFSTTDSWSRRQHRVSRDYASRLASEFTGQTDFLASLAVNGRISSALFNSLLNSAADNHSNAYRSRQSAPSNTPEDMDMIDEQSPGREFDDEDQFVIQNEDEGPLLRRQHASHGTQLRVIYEDEDEDEVEDEDGDELIEMGTWGEEVDQTAENETRTEEDMVAARLAADEGDLAELAAINAEYGAPDMNLYDE